MDVSHAVNVAGQIGQLAYQQANRNRQPSRSAISSFDRLSPSAEMAGKTSKNQYKDCANETPKTVISNINGILVQYTNYPENTLFVCNTKKDATNFIDRIRQKNTESGEYQTLIKRGFVIIPPVKENPVYLVQVAPKSDRARRQEAEGKLAEIQTRYQTVFTHLQHHPNDIMTIKTYINQFIRNSNMASVSNAAISAVNIASSVATGFGVAAIPTIASAVFTEVGEQQLRADCNKILEILNQMDTAYKIG